MVEGFVLSHDRCLGVAPKLRFIVISLFALAVAAAATVLLTMARQLTFVSDDWVLLIGRKGWSTETLLAPFNEHLVLGPLLVYRLVLAVFGMGSAFPFFVASTLMFLLSCALLFVYLRSRVGDWLALLGAIVVLFLGAAYEDLLWPFQIGYFTSVAAGLGMLIALDRKDEKGDRIAYACLGVSMVFSGVGVAFAAGSVVDLFWSWRTRQRRMQLVLLPIALFAIWWLGWGHTAESHFSLDNVVHAPGWILDAAASGMTSLLGLATALNETPALPHLIWGRIVVIFALGLAAVQLGRGRRPSRELAVVVVIGLAFWVLAALNSTWARPPLASRYQYPSAVFILLIAAEAGRGIRPRTSMLVLATGMAAISVFSGVSLLSRAYSGEWRGTAQYTRAGLSGLELAGSPAASDYRYTFGSVNTAASDYLSTVAAYGSPALPRAELLASSEIHREAADQALVQALGLHLRREYPRASARNCDRLRNGTNIRPINVRHGQLTLSNNGKAPAELRVGRVADEARVYVGQIPPDARASLRLPQGSLYRPWHLDLATGGPITICRTVRRPS